MLRYIILKPLSQVYALILFIRHKLYDRGFFFSKSFDQAIIKIGNLSLGGTGKTPHTIFLANILNSRAQIVILSRGYGRKTNGFLEVKLTEESSTYGDEPYMMKMKTNARVFVCGDRVKGVEQINQIVSDPKIIILDDALQHRRLAGGLSILLNDYDKNYQNDHLFPLGNLRDLKSRSEMMDIEIVSKSPEGIDDDIVIHSSIKYLKPIDIYSQVEIEIDSEILLITGIANSDSLVKYLEAHSKIIKHYEYKDHYQYSQNDIVNWISRGVKQIVTTEKDAVKLLPFQNMFKSNEVEVIAIPIDIHFSKINQEKLENELNEYLAKYNL